MTDHESETKTITSTKTYEYVVQLVRKFPFVRLRKKIGIDANVGGKMTTVREEKYDKSDSLCNNIPSILDIVERSTQTNE